MFVATDKRAGKEFQMKKILLIHPYFSYQQGEYLVNFSEPLGLLCLATYVRRYFENSIAVEILDLYALGHSSFTPAGDKIARGISDKRTIVELIRKHSPDLIGVHCNFTGYINDALEVVEAAREAAPAAPIVMGGAHASSHAEQILKTFAGVDFIVRGEGEETFSELIACLRDGKTLFSNVRGLAFRGTEGVVISPDRPLIPSLDSLPMPDRTLIDMDVYKKLNSQLITAMQTPIATIMASRGCPYNCIFCSTKNMWKRHWRARSPQRVIEEIDRLVADYGIREISFCDDQLIGNPDWVSDLCDLIIGRNYRLSLTLPAGTSVWLCSPELLAKMRKAGFYRLNLPVESGSPNTLKFIRKPVHLPDVLKVIRQANQLGFWTTANFIIGFPYETREEIEETIRFAYDCGVDWPVFLIAKPHIGSDMYDIYEQEGLIMAGQGLNSSYFTAMHPTKHFTAAELGEIYKSAVRGYIRHKILWSLKPKNFITHIYPKFATFSGLRYAVKMVMSSLRVLRRVSMKN